MTKQTSSKKKPVKRKLKLSDGSTIETNDNRKTTIKNGEVGKHLHNKEPYSTETGKGDDDWEVTDDYDSHDYPPPSTNPHFRKFWMENIDNITERANFNTAHLGLLEALCRLRVELRALDAFVAKNGHTYRTVNMLGEVRKTYPEVSERLKVLTQIAQFSRLLDLVPKKDSSKNVGKKSKDEDEWG